MNIQLPPGWYYRAAIIALALWILHSFAQALLAACVTAIASWPLYDVAVVALALQMAMKGAGATAALSLAMGCVVLICGDKIVRPAIADNGIRLGFVWVLMGCLGGFEVLGLVGLVVGPVVISLARELWDQRVRDASELAGCSRRAVHERASV
jgi:predicted PurR-regulated permease PerM